MKTNVDEGSTDVQQQTKDLQDLRVACLKKSRSPVAAAEAAVGDDPCRDFRIAQDAAIQATTG